MFEKESSERKFYKAIVTGMSICLPIGIILGVIQNNLILGILAGNTLGIAIGMAISKLHYTDKI